MPNIKQPSIIKDDLFVSILIQKVLKYGGVKVTGLGTFKLSKMPARKKAFNPYTKEYQASKAYIKIKFAPSKNLKEAIQKKKI